MKRTSTASWTGSGKEGKGTMTSQSGILNSDQYLWTCTISDATTESPRSWNSEADFPRDTNDQLSPLEQLAQVLLCSNEFLFVD